MRGTRTADVARRWHMTKPREPTWMPTWREELVGVSVMGSEVDYFLKISIKTSNATEFLNRIFKTSKHQE